MYKSSEVLENIFLCISAFNWPQSVMKVFLNNSLETWNLQSYNPYAINLKGHLLQMLRVSLSKFIIHRCRTIIPYQYLQHFEYSSLGCSKNLAIKRDECPWFWSALTSGFSTLDSLLYVRNFRYLQARVWCFLYSRRTFI